VRSCQYVEKLSGLAGKVFCFIYSVRQCLQRFIFIYSNLRSPTNRFFLSKSTNKPKGYLANGLHPILSAASAVIKTTADAPSDRVDAFPAVMLPPSFWKTVASLPNLSKLTFLYSSSSDTTIGGWPRFVTTETLKSSS
jgi:hypothetical protein